ncbi:hypothetical protein QT995_24755 [Microcoleus sp. S36b_A3]|uniref:hypothetical protein n=1 Tax=unclassified Microcoleus TaxID=2642155 RepID=UPI002FD5C9C9
MNISIAPVIGLRSIIQQTLYNSNATGFDMSRSLIAIGTQLIAPLISQKPSVYALPSQKRLGIVFPLGR